MSISFDLDEATRTLAHDEPSPSAVDDDPVGAPPARATLGPPAMRIGDFVDDELQRVVAAVSLWCGSTDDAEQATADAVGRAWERLDRGQQIDNLAAWVTTVAMNEVRARHRRRARVRRKGHLVAVTGSAAGPADRSTDRIDLQRALTQLGERQRQVVALHYGLDLPIAEIAAQLGIAEGTVKATLHTSRLRLAAELDIADAAAGAAADTEGSRP
ncbi:MAG TPA: sigma-70 family RNA polymerase sigma factor [Acidimicrobiales bacterium]|nr:sigma-70 family RNA polymerase sigma factor [Acidimicrobiales bacterium]